MFPSAPFIGQITLISIASSELGAKKWKSNQKISYEPSKSTWCTVIVYYICNKYSAVWRLLLV